MLFFAAVVVLTGLTAGCNPLYNDDLFYSVKISCIDHRFCPDTNFNFMEYIGSHREITNGRLGDMFIPLFMTLPNWLYGILYGAFYGGIILMMKKLSGLTFTKSPIKTIWLVIFTVLLFPWFDQFYTRAVFLNYYPATLFALISFYFFISPNRLKGLPLISCVLITFCAGWWHEIAAYILFPAMMTYCFITKRITRNQIIISIALLLGFIMTISVPSLYERLFNFNPNDTQYYLKRFCRLLTSALIVLSLSAIIFTIREKSATDTKALSWALVITILPAALLTLITINEARMLFMAETFVLATFFRALPSVRKATVLISTSTFICLTAILIHLVTVTANARVVYRVSENILAQASRNPDKPIYYDLTQLIEKPEYYYLFKSSGMGYVTQYTPRYFPMYTHGSLAYSIIPPELKDFDKSKATRLKAPFGAYRQGDFIVIEPPVDSTEYTMGVTLIRYDDGSEDYNYYIGNYFTGEDNRPYMYLFCYNQTKEDRKPVAIEEFGYEAFSRKINDL